MTTTMKNNDYYDSFNELAVKKSKHLNGGLEKTTSWQLVYVTILFSRNMLESKKNFQGKKYISVLEFQTSHIDIFQFSMHDR